MRQAHALLLWMIAFTLLSQESFTQSSHLSWSVPKSILADLKSKEKIKLPFNLNELKFNNTSDTIGLIGKRKRNEYQLLTYPNREKDLLNAIHTQYSILENGTNISMRIDQFDIHEFKIGQASAEDTFFFRCTFLKKTSEEPEEELFQFKAKNLMGALELAEESFSYYVMRVLNQSIQQFSKSFDLNPNWNILNDTGSSMVSTQFIYNQQLGKDSISCQHISQLDSSYFNSNTKKDSLQTPGHCRLILTYAILAEENKGKLNLLIHTKSFLSKSRSWINPNLANESWYEYQLGHVKIATIYGHRLNEEFKKTKFSYGEYKFQANQAYNKVYDEYVKFRKQYADETGEGTINVKMKEWNDKLRTMSKF